MDRMIDDYILNEKRNHQLMTSALIQYLALKGIIDADEYFRYLDDFSMEVVKRNYPELFPE